MRDGGDRKMNAITCREDVKPSGKNHARITPSESTSDAGLETNGNGLAKRGGKCSSNFSSSDPTKPFGCDGKAKA